jgi:hypothetical protein
MEQTEELDALIIGAGVSGLYADLKANLTRFSTGDYFGHVNIVDIAKQVIELANVADGPLIARDRRQVSIQF